MASRMEQPDAASHSWERHSHVVEAALPAHVQVRVGSEAQKGLCWEHVAAAWLDPLLDEEEAELRAKAAEADRARTQANLMHGLDLQLRQAVGDVMKEVAECGLEKKALGSIAKACADIRKRWVV